MIKKTVRGMIQLIGGLGAGFAIVVMLIAWQFSRGPIPLGFLSPYIESAVNDGSRDFTLKMGDTILTWAGWERALDIRVLDVRVINRVGTTVGSIPEASFSVSGGALVRGDIAPKNIELFGPKLRFRRGADGKIDVGFGGAENAAEGAAIGLLSQLIETPTEGRFLRYLTHVAIVGGDITVVDQVLQKTWHMPAADVRLNRYIDRLHGEMALLLETGEHQVELDVIGDYVMASRRLKLDMNFKNAAPAVFAALTPRFAHLAALDMPFAGNITLEMPIDGGVDSFGISVSAGTGQLRLPAPFDQNLKVRSVKLQAGYSGADGRADIKELTVSLAKGSHVKLPGQWDHNMPLSAFSLEASILNGGGKIDVRKLTANLNGPRVTLKGMVLGVGEKGKPTDIEVAGRLETVPLAGLEKIWPEALATDTRNWILAHMRKGLVPFAEMQGKFQVLPGGGIKVARLNGTMRAEGADVDYLPPLAKVTGAAADMAFDHNSFTIRLDKGVSRGVSIKSGSIVFTGLDQFDQFADIDLRLEGELGKQLEYVDQKSLGFATAVGIDPAKAKGHGATRLKLFFILEKTLTWDQVQIWARSKLSNVSMAEIFLGRDIRNGALDLRVDKRGMDVSGKVKFDSIPATLKWRENFSKKADFKSRYSVKAEIADVKHVRDLGLDMQPFSGDYIRGSVKADIEFTVLDDVDRRLEVKADITKASLSVPSFDWSKPSGVDGNANVVLNLARGLVVDIPKFSVKAKDLDVRGKAKYALDGTGLERIEFSKIAYGRTAMKGALIPKPDGGWEAGFHGKSFDLSHIWKDILADGGDSISGDQPLLDKLTLAVEFDQVWLDEKAMARKVSGTFVRDRDLWRKILLKSRIDEDTDFDLQVLPNETGNRSLSLVSDNAGEVFKFLDLYSNMSGGDLKITGTYDDAAPGQPLKGVISVKDYRISNAPALAHVLSIMALTGILDVLEGNGLAFSDLEVPFDLNQGTFRLKDAKATGVSLGFTASGKVFRHADVVDLEGTVIPAYAINSAFGRIPLLGGLLTGGEEGGGVFAANYTMTGPTEKPIVSVNPLSALTPGFLRNVFGIFGKAEPEPKSDLLLPEEPSTGTP